MRRLLVDDALRSQLDGLQSQAEFCDNEGNVLGYYIPLADQRQRYERAKSQLSAAEIESRSRDAGGLTTAEVMQRLHELNDE